MSLPTLTLTLCERNPDFEPKFRPGENRAYNMDEYQKEYEIEVEIVQLNLNSGGMRVRYEWPDKHAKRGVSMQSRDVPLTAFYEKFNIVEIDK